MSYVNDTLLPGETVRFRGHVHWIIFLPCLFWLALALAMYFGFDQFYIALALSIIGAVRFGRAVVYFFTTELAVTDQRIISKFGLISRTTFELPLDRVTTLNVLQSVLGRLFNYGDLEIHAMGQVAVPIPVVADPLTFRKWVLGEIERAR
jgi:uncharacterized membrane protein YdbT with pleckstrin-like domain